MADKSFNFRCGGICGAILAAIASRTAKRIATTLGGLVTGSYLIAQSPEVMLDRRAVREHVLADQRRVEQIARPDPWRGKDGRETRAMVRENAVAIQRLRVMQALDDQHREQSREGYGRIRDCEKEVTRLRAHVDDLRQEVHDIEATTK